MMRQLLFTIRWHVMDRWRTWRWHRRRQQRIEEEVARIAFTVGEVADRLGVGELDADVVESPEAAAQGDRIVELARKRGFGAPEGAELAGPPFKHDVSEAPLMVDVSGVQCEHPGCEAPALEHGIRVLTPWGAVCTCRLHGQVICAVYGVPGTPTESEREELSWVRDAARFGPHIYRRRLEWIATGGKAEALEFRAAHPDEEISF